MSNGRQALAQAIERLENSIHWLQHGREAGKLLALDDMKALHAALVNASQKHQEAPFFDVPSAPCRAFGGGSFVERLAVREVQPNASQEHQAGAHGSSFALASDRRSLPLELLDRIESALQRHLDDHGPKRIPADPTDSDLVLYDIRQWRQGKPPGWWAPRSLPAPPAPLGDASTAAPEQRNTEQDDLAVPSFSALSQLASDRRQTAQPRYLSIVFRLADNADGRLVIEAADRLPGAEASAWSWSNLMDERDAWRQRASIQPSATAVAEASEQDHPQKGGQLGDTGTTKET